MTTSRRPPNIVLILADDLGYGDVSCQNPNDGDAPKVPTPHFDRVAREGMRFSDAHSGSAVCTPTRYGLLTGRYAWRTRLQRGVLWGYDQPLIEGHRLTLPQLLKRHGYATAGVGKWHLGLGWQLTSGASSPEAVDYGAPLTHGPTHLGFDRYFGIPASLDMDPYVYLRDERVETLPTERIEASPRPAFYRGGPISPGFTMEGVMPRLTSEAVSFIQDRKARPDAPFFLYFPTTSPHTPHVPNAPFHGRSAAGLYGDFVVEWDDAVGQVLRALDDSGVAENTLVIVTSDNGADLRGGQPEHGHDSNGFLTGQKADIWDGGHRIPFAARWPGLIPAGTLCDQTICLTDVLATCAELLDAPLRPGTDIEGPDSVSLVPALTGGRLDREAPALRDFTVHHASDGMFAARRGPWKLVLGHGSGGFSRPQRVEPGPHDPPGRLYHMWDDPTEQTNLWTERPDVVEQLQSLLTRTGGG
ncbi:MAG TPA: arylsulfatase [Chloroflexota bacterium]|nr:arylsulfatase [Chloroflexota bacterium]